MAQNPNDTGALLKKADEEIQKAKSKSTKETNKSQTVLAQAKDRAQVTSATAMSIVGVALLKEVVDQGPAGAHHYTATVSMIIASLILQVLSGVLAMMVTSLMSYANKYGGNAMADCRENLFFCRCVKVKKTKKAGKRKGLADPESGQSGQSEAGTSAGKRAAGPNLLGTDWLEGYTADGHTGDGHTPEDEGLAYQEEQTRGCCCGLCPCDLSTEVYDSHEYNIIRLHDMWLHHSTEDELSAIRAGEELKYQVGAVEAAKKKVSDLEEELKGSGAEAQEVTQRLERLRADLETAQARKVNYEWALRRREVLERQGKLLRQLKEDIRKQRIMKVVSFWQEIINYVLYVVFVLNAFIVGFGVVDTAIPTAAVAGAGANATRGVAQ